MKDGISSYGDNILQYEHKSTLYSYHFFRIGRRRYVLLHSYSVKRLRKKKREKKRVLRTLCLSSFPDLMMITEAANNSDRYTASLAGAGW